MNNVIELNKNTLTHFSKRLQKAIKDELGQDIKLTTAYRLLAKSAGAKDLFELKKRLPKSKENVVTNYKAPSSNTISPELKDVLNQKDFVGSFIADTAYAMNEDGHKLRFIEMFLDYDGLPYLLFTAKERSNPSDDTFFSFYFYNARAESCYQSNLDILESGHSLSLDKMVLTEKDVDFIKRIAHGYFPKDPIAAVSMGREFIKRFGVEKKGGSSLFVNKDIDNHYKTMYMASLKGGHLYQKKYFAVDEDFFDKNEISWTTNEGGNFPVAKVDGYLSKATIIADNDVMDILQTVGAMRHIIIEVFEDTTDILTGSKKNHNAYCSRLFLHDASNKLGYICSVDGSYRIPLVRKTLEWHQGYMDRLCFKFTLAHCPYRYANDIRLTEWQAGMEAAIKSELITKDVKKVVTKINQKP